MKKSTAQKGNRDRELSEKELKQCEGIFTSILEEMAKRFVPDNKRIRKAYEFALKQHGAARRRSGEPYIIHPLEVARELAKVGFEDDIIISALLHDVLEDCDVTKSELENLFGTLVADTVDAVSEVGAALKDKGILKRDLDFMSDYKFLTETTRNKNRRAFYIKLADRIHNLSTISCFPVDKQIAKAHHTRQILIPAAKKLHIFLLVDILESLCLQIEHPDIFKVIHEGYQNLMNENVAVLEGKNGLQTYWKEVLAKEKLLKEDSVVALEFHRRYEDSIFRHLTENLNNIHDLQSRINKENIPLLNINFVVSDKYDGKPMELFLKIYPLLYQSPFRLTIVGSDHTMGSGAYFYKLTDRYSNQYRLFVQTESELLRYSHGGSEGKGEDMIRAHIPYINEAEPDEPEHKMITVYKKDGNAMQIEEGATVLDFAFKIHRKIGICAKYALLNGLKTQLPLYTRLQPGDVVYIESDHKKNEPDKDIPHATVRWFEYLHTRDATKALSRWLEKHMDIAYRTMSVHDSENKEQNYNIPIGSTVLDFAFYVEERTGLHLSQAFINGSRKAVDFDTILKYDDVVRFQTDQNKEPELTWLSIVKSQKAKDALVQYFSKKF